MRHFFTLQKNVQVCTCDQQRRMAVFVCVSYSTDQSMGSCFFHLCHICSHADLSSIFFFFKSPLTKKMRMGPNRIHLKRGRYEKKCTDLKLLFRSYSLGNKNILHVTRKLIQHEKDQMKGRTRMKKTSVTFFMLLIAHGCFGYGNCMGSIAQ